MRLKTLNLQYRIVYILSVCCIMLCIIFNALTAAVIYCLITTCYFHYQIISNKMSLKQYILMNCLLIIIFLLITSLLSFIFINNRADIVIGSLGLELSLVVSSIYLKKHFKL